MKLRSLALVVCATILGSAACGANSGKLDLLRHERMSTVDIPGTRQGRTDERDEHSSLGKPVSARILRELPLADPSAATTVLIGARQIARDDRWDEGDSPPPGGAWLLTKQVNGDRLELGLQLTADGTTLVLTLTDLGGA